MAFKSFVVLFAIAMAVEAARVKHLLDLTLFVFHFDFGLGQIFVTVELVSVIGGFLSLQLLDFFQELFLERSKDIVTSLAVLRCGEGHLRSHLGKNRIFVLASLEAEHADDLSGSLIGLRGLQKRCTSEVIPSLLSELDTFNRLLGNGEALHLRGTALSLGLEVFSFIHAFTVKVR